MDELARKGLIRRGTRASFLSNRLVLIVPAGAPLDIAIRRGFPLARRLGAGRLAMADPDAVPAGRYGRQALVSPGVCTQVAPNIVRAANVRAGTRRASCRDRVGPYVYILEIAVSVK